MPQRTRVGQSAEEGGPATLGHRHSSPPAHHVARTRAETGARVLPEPQAGNPSPHGRLRGKVQQTGPILPHRPFASSQRTPPPCSPPACGLQAVGKSRASRGGGGQGACGFISFGVFMHSHHWTECAGPISQTSSLRPRGTGSVGGLYPVRAWQSPRGVGRRALGRKGRRGVHSAVRFYSTGSGDRELL